MILFENIKWSNFCSYGDVPFSVNFRDASVFAFTGKNGSGKSTLLDALSFALYGKPWRKVVKGKLVNNRNKRGARVEVNFSTDKHAYKVVRGIKPDVFEIWRGEELLNQDSKARDYQKALEDEILGLSWEAFNQVVVIGKATYVPFMQLDTPKRRAFVESVLSLQIFSEMKKLLSADSSAVDRDLSAAKATKAATIPLVSQSESSLKTLEEMKSAGVSAEIVELKEAVECATSVHEEKDLEWSNLMGEVSDLEKSLQEKLDESNAQAEREVVKAKAGLDAFDGEISSAESELNTLKSQDQGVERDISRLRQEIAKLDTREVCPTCGAAMDASQSLKHKKEIEDKITGLEREIASRGPSIASSIDKIAEIRKRRNEASSLWADAIRKEREVKARGFSSWPEYVRLVQDAKNAEAEVKQVKRDIDSMLERIKQAEERAASLDGKIEEAKTKLEANKALLSKYAEDEEALDFASQVMSATQSMLKDTGVKATIVRRYIPVINEIVNKLLADMGFFARFELDENFDDKILSRGFEEMTYNSFSEGEKLRIDMAVLLAWRELCVLTGSSATNLVVFDEILDASFDQEGLDAFMTAMVERDELHLIVITHHPERLDHFVEKRIGFHKVDGYSRGEEVTE